MTLARYTGPLRAFIGTVGHAVTDPAQGGLSLGIMVAGRLRRGRTTPPTYQVFADDDGSQTWDSWQSAARALASWLEPRDPDAAATVRRSEPDPAGLVVVVDGVTYALRPV